MPIFTKDLFFGLNYNKLRVICQESSPGGLAPRNVWAVLFRTHAVMLQQLPAPRSVCMIYPQLLNLKVILILLALLL
jgi:hypothetical protein